MGGLGNGSKWICLVHLNQVGFGLSTCIEILLIASIKIIS